MTYLPFAILLGVTLVALTAVGKLRPNWYKPLTVVNGVLGLLGIALALAIHLLALSKLHSEALTPAFLSWAKDMYGIWYQIALPVFGVLFGFLLCSTLLSLGEKHHEKGHAPVMRMILSCASSVVMLILAPFYGFMTENETLPLYQYILWSGIGLALAFRLLCALEYGVRLWKGKKTAKK